MRKNDVQERERTEFIQLTVNDCKAAARRLRYMASQMEKAKNTMDRVSILSSLLYVSESTILRELKKG